MDGFYNKPGHCGILGSRSSVAVIFFLLQFFVLLLCFFPVYYGQSFHCDDSRGATVGVLVQM